MCGLFDPPLNFQIKNKSYDLNAKCVNSGDAPKSNLLTQIKAENKPKHVILQVLNTFFIFFHKWNNDIAYMYIFYIFNIPADKPTKHNIPVAYNQFIMKSSFNI